MLGNRTQSVDWKAQALFVSLFTNSSFHAA